MASFTAGTSFSDGVANDVTAAKLGALVSNATPTSGFIQDRTTETVVATNDTLLIGDASDSNNLKRMTVANLLKAPIVTTSGTVDNLTTGTTTSTAQIVTSGTTATLNSTTGTIATLNSTTGTIATLNSTTGTIATLNSTTGTIGTLVATGTITGSTNVVNIGSGQIYKDASGNVGIGVTPSTWGTGEYKAIQVGIGGSISGRVSSGDQDKVNVAANVYNDGAVFKYIASDDATIYQQTGGVHIFSNAPSGTAGNTATFTERLRITSGGYLKASDTGAYVNSGASFHELRNSASEVALLASNSNAVPQGIQIRFTSAPNDATSQFLNCNDGNGTTNRAIIRSNGGILNYQANDGNLSDERLKTDIQPSPSYLSKICSIPIVNFKYKDQTHDDYNLGVIAQQVEAVCPEFVDADGVGETPEDGIPIKAIYQTDLQFALMKCIQELKSENDSLKSRIEALEAA